MCMLLRSLGFMGFFFFHCLIGCLSMIVRTPAVLSVLYACVLYFCICTCSAQVSMFHVERRSLLLLLLLSINVSFKSPPRWPSGLASASGPRDPTRLHPWDSRRTEPHQSPLGLLPDRATPVTPGTPAGQSHTSHYSGGTLGRNSSLVVPWARCPDRCRVVGSILL